MQIHILIVDDKEYITRTYARMLRSTGHLKTQAQSYQEAVAALEQAEFDLAIIDYIMPDICGDELARFIRKNYPEMAIIMISAQPDDALLHDGFGIADRFIPKVQLEKTLLPNVSEVLDEKSAENTRLQRHFSKWRLSLRQSTDTPSQPDPISDNGLHLDIANNDYVLGTTPLALTSQESAVLAILAAHAPDPVRRAHLESIVQSGPDDESAAARLRRVVHSLRAKLDAVRPGLGLLKTTHGVGYYLDMSQKRSHIPPSLSANLE